MAREPLEPEGRADALRPEPVRAPWLSALVGFGASLVLVGGAVLPALLVRTESTRGAPRSVHLERQKRQQQARQAAAREAAGQENAADDARPDPDH